MSSTPPKSSQEVIGSVNFGEEINDHARTLKIWWKDKVQNS